VRSGETYKKEMSKSEVNYKVGDLVEHGGPYCPRGMGIVVELDEDDDPIVYYFVGSSCRRTVS